jgi:hypothetical protein
MITHVHITLHDANIAKIYHTVDGQAVAMKHYETLSIRQLDQSWARHGHGTGVSSQSS